MFNKLAPALFLISTVLIFILVSRPFNPPPSPPPSLPAPTPAVASHQPSQLTINQKTFRYYFRKIKDSEFISLIPNFQEQLTSNQIIQQNDCLFGINGGFYLPDNLPLGLFQIGQKEYGKYSNSHIFNGFLRQSTDNYPTILDYPRLQSLSSSANFILQSGPLYLLNKSPKVKYDDTKSARRHLIVQGANFDTYLFSIFGADNSFDGPTLNDISDFFNHPQIQSIASFISALNLDGGSASAFYDQSQKIKVEELKPIGSFLCGQLKSPN